MDRVNLVVAGVLVLAAAASAAGVLTYEDDRLAAFALVWTSEAVEIPLDAATATGATAEATFDVDLDAANVSAVDVRVRVVAANAAVQPASVLVEVTAPSGETFTEEGTVPAGAAPSVEVVVAVPVRPAPVDREVSAASADAARALADAEVGANGTGAWTVLVRVASGAPGPLGGVASHTVSGTFTATRYEADVRAVLPEVQR